MTNLLDAKVIVIVGGAGLLGRGFSAAAAEEGGTVIVADRDLAAAEAIAKAITAKGQRASAEAVDISDPASVDALIARVRKAHGKIDGVVNTAYPHNKNWGRAVEEVTYADFCENVNLHLGGYFLVTQRFAMAMKTAGGSIVNLASIYGSIAPRFEVYEGTKLTMPVEYAAIKSAIIQLSRYFAQYYKRNGVRVNTLSPGGILDKQPEAFVANYGARAGAKGMLSVEDVTGALVFLLSEGARHVTGQDLVVDDGFSL